MRPPKRRHSDPRNVHIASFSLEMPVVVTCSWSGPTSSSLRAAARSLNECGLLGRGGVAARVVGFGGVGGLGGVRDLVAAGVAVDVVVVVAVALGGVGGGLH